MSCEWCSLQTTKPNLGLDFQSKYPKSLPLQGLQIKLVEVFRFAIGPAFAKIRFNAHIRLSPREVDNNMTRNLVAPASASHREATRSSPLEVATSADFRTVGGMSGYSWAPPHGQRNQRIYDSDNIERIYESEHLAKPANLAKHRQRI